MKYHTTAFNIVASLLMLFIVLVLVVVFNVLQVMPNYAHALTESVLARLSGSGNLVISVSSLDTSLFKGLTLNELKISTREGVPIAEATTVSVQNPLYRFLWRPLYPQQVSISIHGLSVDTDQHVLDPYLLSSSETPTGIDIMELLEGRTISLTLSHSDFRYSSGKESTFRAEKVDAFASIRNGEVVQGRVSTGRAAFESTFGSAFIDGSTLSFGTTDLGTVGLRFDVARSDFSYQGAYTGSADLNRWGLSFTAESYEQLLEGSGQIGVDLSGIQVASEMFDHQALVTMQLINAGIELTSGEVTHFDLSIPSVALNYGSWESTLEALHVSGEDLGATDYSIHIDSPSFLSVTENQTVLAEVFAPEVRLQVSAPSERIQFDAERLVLQQQDHPLMKRLLGETVWDRIFLDDPYLLFVNNAETEERNIESSALLSSTTFIPYFETVQGDFSGSLSLDRSGGITRGQLFIDDFESTELPGLFRGSLLYLPDLPDSDDFSAEISHTNGIQLALGYDTREELARTTLRLNQTRPFEFISILQSLSPNVAALIESDTTLQGNVSFTVDPNFETGRASTDLGVTNLAVEDQRFNIATTFSGLLEPDSIRVDLATITTEGYRLSYQGSVDRTRFFPEGTLQISQVESGSTIASADFNRLASQRYEYRITSPIFAESSFAGDVSWEADDELNAHGVLAVPGAEYPVSIIFDQSIGLLSLDSDNASVLIDLLSTPGHITFDLALASLALPPMDGETLRGIGVVDGSIAADFSLAEELFIVTSPQLQITGLSWGDQDPFTFSLKFDADPQEMRIEDLLYDDPYGIVSGYLSVQNRSLVELMGGRLYNFSALGEMTGANDERIAISLFPKENNPGIAQGIVELQRFELGRFFSERESITLEASLVGETDLVESFFGHAIGELTLHDSESSLSAHIHAESQGIVLEEGVFNRGGMNITVDEMLIPYTGQAELSAQISIPFPIIWRDATTRAKVHGSAELAPAANLFEFVQSNFTGKHHWPDLTVSHSDVLILGDIPWESGTHVVSISPEMIAIRKGEGGTVEGSYHFGTGEVELETVAGFPIPLRAEGRITEREISLSITDLLFDITYVNSVLLEPIITFEGGLFSGSLLIDGPLSDPDYYGTLTANSVELTTFWTIGELFSLKNPVITVSENLATVSPSPVSAVHTSGRRAQGRVQLEASLERWSVPHYRIDILEMSNPISLWIPMITTDVNVNGMVNGSFSIDGTPTAETLYGDVTVSDTLISFGLPELPIWVNAKERTSIDMTLRTGRNVSFIFPNEEAPILRATFADEQAIDITVEAPSMATSFMGELAFRSGEIYYVQKNFYITEGSLRFPSSGTGLTEDFMPRLSLRARLREFEADGTRIDIYLVLQESRFDDLDPRFESIPMRSTNEILELLGQNLVSMGADRDSGATSVVAVASAATDVISRLGLLQTTTISLGFSNIIRESLGLDVFTIRTNLLQNILLEALPGIAADTAVSPIARYLDNTTMYIGKYLLDDFYLQGMLHFRRDYFGSQNTFLASDLRIDTELSVEWTNPLATFSFFTQPEELSVFDLFDTMGFSITKRFEF